jgi:uncharacterized membrane protein YfcA
MSYIVIGLVSLLVSLLTLFSGFGLGTLLLPAFLIFFPAPVAIAATAIVHLSNNLFKVVFVGKKANWKVVALFSVPATFAALLGAFLISRLSDLPTLFQYQWLGKTLTVSALNLTVACLMALFAFLELSPQFQRLSFPGQLIPVGGLLSGFFGGLTGHQGALRSAFLIRAGLDKESFIGTTVISAILIDIARLGVYGTTFLRGHFRILAAQDQVGLIIVGIVSAFLGTYLGSRFIHKVTLPLIQRLVGGLLMLYAVLLGTGLI